MQKISFVTGNKGKYLEVKEIMDKFGIEVEHIDQGKPEIDSDELTEIAKYSAKTLANQLKKTVVIEDTGFYFDAFNNFPGTRPKFVVNGIGLKGVLKLLDGEKRGAKFVTVAAICKPNGEAKTFEGMIKGRIAEKIMGVSHPQLPFDSIFIPEGHDKTFAEEPSIKVQKNHRKIAFEELGNYLLKHKN